MAARQFRLPSYRLPVDGYVLLIVLCAATAAVIPARGIVAEGLDQGIKWVIALLFFLYGARLSPQAAWAGAKHWRLHLVVFAATFILFPLLGLALQPLVGAGLLSPQLYAGVILLCALPSTVQSSIAFTSIARGNVAAAICSASVSSLIGIIITPVVVGLILHNGGSGPLISLHDVEKIGLQLFVPFLAGQLSRPLTARWMERQRKLLGYVDRGSILLVVYSAFSEGMVSGMWHQIGLSDVAVLLLVNAALLGAMLGLTTLAARKLGFHKADEITIVFCGSKKSLAAGLPMATVLFPAGMVGLAVLPLMLFHQMQLMVCAAMARRYAKRPEEDTGRRPGNDAGKPGTAQAA
ncbi:bile acid:sodium symporter family protein [Ferrovibrio xuzhouensis]|uniref:Bile acid:sodium symporter family protein n=1 Tax=Ferrovibrio xuzhouensis TaxID=1576914 RepID=A0ABV7VLM1_9PROT